MNHKKLLTPASATTLLTIILTFVFFQILGKPLQDLLNAVFVSAIYGLLLISYLLRMALVFFGVFAVYRMLRERVNGLEYQQKEV